MRQSLLQIIEKINLVNEKIDHMGIECLFVEGDFVQLLKVITPNPPMVGDEIWIDNDEVSKQYKVLHIEQTFTSGQIKTHSILVTVEEIQTKT